MLSSLETPSYHVKEAMKEALEARNESLRLAEEYIIAEGLDQIERTLKFINELNPEKVPVSYLKELCNQILSSSEKILFVKPLLYAVNKVYKEEDLTKISNSFYFQLIQSVSNLLGVPAEEIFECLDVDEIANNFDYDSIETDCLYELLDNFMNSGVTPKAFSFYYNTDFISPLIRISDSLKFTDEIITSIMELCARTNITYCTESIFICKLLEKMSEKTLNSTLIFKMIGTMYRKPEFDVFINFTLPKGAKFNFTHLKEVFQVDSLYDIEKSWQKSVIKHLLSLDLIEEELALEIKLTDLVDKLSVLVSEKVSITLV